MGEKMSDSRALQRTGRGGICSADLLPAPVGLASDCCNIRLMGAASALFRCLHCGFKSVAFFLDVAGLVALKSSPNGVPEHEPCIFKFFLLPRLVTRIMSLRLKRALWCVKPDDAE